MSVMKAIWQMQNETEQMRASGMMTEEEIETFVEEFCDTYNFSKPNVKRIMANADGGTDMKSGFVELA